MIIPTIIIAAAPAAALIAIASVAGAAPLWPVAISALVAPEVTSMVTVLIDRVLLGKGHVVVKNGDGIVVGRVVPTDRADPPSSALFSCANATFGSIFSTGDRNRLLHPPVFIEVLGSTLFILRRNVRVVGVLYVEFMSGR